MQNRFRLLEHKISLPSFETKENLKLSIFPGGTSDTVYADCPYFRSGTNRHSDFYHGELYMQQSGSNTNGGIPGKLPASRIMRENFFSAATLVVANLGQSCFQGTLTSSAEIDGNPLMTGYGPKRMNRYIFAHGNRNP